MHLKERIANGMLFYEHGHKDPIDIAQEQELDALRRHCKEVMFDYNHTRPNEREKRLELLKGLLGKCGDGVFIEDGVHMSYGCHLYLEGAFYANFNLSVVDDGDIYIGDRTMIGPNVTLCTTGHRQIRSTVKWRHIIHCRFILAEMSGLAAMQSFFRVLPLVIMLLLVQAVW